MPTEQTCTIEGCDEPYRASGYCKRHYDRWHSYGDPLHEKERPPERCTVEGCDNKHLARGLCSKHYQRERDVERDVPCSVDGCTRPARVVGPPAFCNPHYKRLKRRGGTFARAGDHGDITERLDAQSVGVAGGCINWTSRPNGPHGYGRIRWGEPNLDTGRRRYFLAHRVAWALWNDVAPDDIPPLLRHTCNNSMCINPLHLEPGTHSQNQLDAVRAGRHGNRKLSRFMAERLDRVLARHSVERRIIDAVVEELQRPG